MARCLPLGVLEVRESASSSAGGMMLIFLAMASAVSLLSPVIMKTRMPAERQSAIAAVTSARGGSSSPTNPMKVSWLSTLANERHKTRNTQKNSTQTFNAINSPATD
eukprot:GHVT01017288.1.p2 GENE.GHVT01017288.1~~GHVT01017288.1.p2  ORF type:complete len:107 (-),score=17.76 GHVT01017288.1:256-576(-)